MTKFCETSGHNVLPTVRDTYGVYALIKVSWKAYDWQRLKSARPNTNKRKKKVHSLSGNWDTARRVSCTRVLVYRPSERLRGIITLWLDSFEFVLWKYLFFPVSITPRERRVGIFDYDYDYDDVGSAIRNRTRDFGKIIYIFILCSCAAAVPNIVYAPRPSSVVLAAQTR